MKIATWNLERALPQSGQAERQRQWLNRIDADLLVLTETHLGMTPENGYHSIASGPRHRTPEHGRDIGERWVQIWVREDWAIAPLETSNDLYTACALVDCSGRSCLLYGTVLPWPETADQDQVFATALAAQQADWQRLRATYPEAVLIVAGDFNQDLNALHYFGSRRNKQALRQALDRVGLACLTAGENDPVHQLLNSQHSNTDHICVTHNSPSQFQQAFVWPQRLEDLRGLSDHFGVGVEISVGP
jgi:endonuclease/exonuclease/phosphatase family metal-dependent hydrolase